MTMDPLTGRSKGFCFLEFAEPACAEAAMAMDGFELAGRKIKVGKPMHGQQAAAATAAPHPLQGVIGLPGMLPGMGMGMPMVGMMPGMVPQQVSSIRALFQSSYSVINLLLWFFFLYYFRWRPRCPPSTRPRLMTTSPPACSSGMSTVQYSTSTVQVQVQYVLILGDD